MKTIEIINVPDVPDDADLTAHETLEERIEKLEEGIKAGIQCLTSGNSVMISDPRPAIKYLKEALDE